ncbi:hypothetical protein H0H92_008304 [Tricholoma furcatifolium]|nr:hypothetical protein H0H92_008304 [Tricholoma furcatifolium]
MTGEFLAKYVPRIRRLVLQYADSDARSDGLMEHLVEGRWSRLVGPLQHASRIEHLDIGVSRLRDSIDQAGIVISSPHLKYLSLEGCRMSLDSVTLSTFGNLRYLDLSRLSMDMRIPMTRFWNILSHTPLLETLKVYDSLEDMDLGLTPPYAVNLAPIHLRFLQKLNVQCWLPTATVFFHHLTFPRNIKSITFISTILDDREIDDFERYIPHVRGLGKTLVKAVKGVIRHLSINGIWCSTSRHSRRALSTPLRTRTHGRKLRTDTLQFMFHSYLGLFPNEYLPAWRNAFLESLRLNQLTSLHVTGAPGLSAEDWSLFGDLPKLRRIKVPKTYFGFLDAFSMEWGTKTTRPRRSFVSLRSLQIVGWDLKEKVFCPAISTIAKKLDLAFKIRGRKALKLRTLKLEGCKGVSVRNWKLLKKNVNIMGGVPYPPQVDLGCIYKD